MVALRLHGGVALACVWLWAPPVSAAKSRAADTPAAKPAVAVARVAFAERMVEARPVDGIWQELSEGGAVRTGDRLRTAGRLGGTRARSG